jgi:hypothetical protein
MKGKIIFLTICWLSIFCNAVIAQNKTAILSENFDNNKNGWAEMSFEDGEFAIKNGFYHFEHKRMRGAWVNSIPVNIPTDVSYEIIAGFKTVRSIDMWSFGLVWGKDDNSNQYEFTINKGGEYCIEKQEGETQTSLAYKRWIASSAIVKGDGAVNELKVISNGTELIFYINNTKVQELSYEKPYGNQVGFKINQNQKIAIDYLIINKI